MSLDILNSYTSDKIDDIPDCALQSASRQIDLEDAAELENEKENLLAVYNALDDQGRQIMNYCFVNITGYELSSIAKWSPEQIMEGL